MNRHLARGYFPRDGFFFGFGLSFVYESLRIFFRLHDQMLSLAKGRRMHLFGLIFNFKNLFNTFFIHCLLFPDKP